MGQAKRRGTFEERQEAARRLVLEKRLERERLEREYWASPEGVAILQRRKEEREKAAADREAYGRFGGGFGAFGAVALLGMAGMGVGMGLPRARRKRF